MVYSVTTHKYLYRVSVCRVRDFGQPLGIKRLRQSIEAESATAGNSDELPLNSATFDLCCRQLTTRIRLRTPNVNETLNDNKQLLGCVVGEHHAICRLSKDICLPSVI